MENLLYSYLVFRWYFGGTDAKRQSRNRFSIISIGIPLMDHCTPLFAIRVDEGVTSVKTEIETNILQDWE